MKSDLQKICLGSANFGSKYGINGKKGIKNNDLRKILNYASKNNIHFVDTAINYNNSEKKIGLVKRYNLKIITKLPKIPKKIINVDKWIVNKISGSCKRLKIKNLYGVLVHDTAELKNRKKLEKIHKAFDFLLKKKIVKKVGLSIYDPKELNLFFEKYNYKIIQAPINIFDRRLILSGWGKKLIKKKVEIFARSVFLKGLLLRDLDKIPKDFKKWKKNFSNF